MSNYCSFCQTHVPPGTKMCFSGARPEIMICADCIRTALRIKRFDEQPNVVKKPQ